jgi:hypothetical protein
VDAGLAMRMRADKKTTTLFLPVGDTNRDRV